MISRRQIAMQVLPFDKSARVAAMLPVSDFGAARGSADCDVVMLTRKGLIKRTPLKQFASINRLGLAAMGVRVSCAPTVFIFLEASHPPEAFGFFFWSDKQKTHTNR